MGSEWLKTTVIVSLAGTLLHVLILLLLTFVALRWLRRATERVRQNWLRASSRDARGDSRSTQANATVRIEELEKRSRTVAEMVRQSLTVLVLVVAMMSMANQAGFDISALLGATSILSLAIGFGARGLVQDIVNGIFLLAENQIREGDVVRIRNISGTVEALHLRYLRLRSGDGVVHILPNGSIGEVANLSYQFAYSVMELKLSYHAGLDQVFAVLEEIGRELHQDPNLSDSLVGDLELLGVDSFHRGGPVLKMRIKTRAHRKWAVGRAVNRRVKQRFDELGIAFPLVPLRIHPSQSPACGNFSRAAIKHEVRVLLSNGDLPVH